LEEFENLKPDERQSLERLRNGMGVSTTTNDEHSGASRSKLL
jgi:hypothetical protein